MSPPNVRHTGDIDSAGPHIIVRMTANNALHASGRFFLFDAAKNLLEQWTMSVDASGQINHSVGTPPDQLCDGFLTWRVVVCSHDPNINSGEVEVTVRQSGSACNMNPPALYTLGPDTDVGQAVPPCEDGMVIPITDDLRFECQ